MKNLILVLTLFFTGSLFGQNSISLKEQLLKEAFYKLEECYIGKVNGKKIGLEDLLEQYSYCTKQIEKLDALFRTKYPVYFDLTNHMIASLDERKPLKACLALRQASKNYQNIDTLSMVRASGLKIDYKEKFGIDLSLIEKFYSSEYCVKSKINVTEACEREAKIKEIIELEPEIETPIKTPKLEKELGKDTFQEIHIKSKGNVSIEIKKEESTATNHGTQMSIYDNDPIEMLRKAIALGLLNSEFFEIKEMIPGDSRILPGVNGVPYEFKLKNANSKEVIYFDPAEYIINDKRDEEDNKKWEEYSIAIDELKTLVLTVLEIHGNSSFQIFVQGGADKPTFIEKSLPPPFNTKFFSEIEVMRVDDRLNGLVKDTIWIGDTYNNKELPDLRGAFASYILRLSDRVKSYSSKICIVKGFVKNFEDTTERNCTMYIYIDWKKARLKSNQQHSKIFDYEKSNSG